jgi:hypothetical protein
MASENSEYRHNLKVIFYKNIDYLLLINDNCMWGNMYNKLTFNNWHKFSHLFLVSLIIPKFCESIDQKNEYGWWILFNKYLLLILFNFIWYFALFRFFIIHIKSYLWLTQLLWLIFQLFLWSIYHFNKCLILNDELFFFPLVHANSILNFKLI